MIQKGSRLQNVASGEEDLVMSPRRLFAVAGKATLTAEEVRGQVGPQLGHGRVFAKCMKAAAAGHAVQEWVPHIAFRVKLIAITYTAAIAALGLSLYSWRYIHSTGAHQVALLFVATSSVLCVGCSCTCCCCCCCCCCC